MSLDMVSHQFSASNALKESFAYEVTILKFVLNYIVEFVSESVHIYNESLR